MFALRTETVDGAAICRVQGEVDAASAPAMREALVKLTAHRKVILDFSGVPFIDSAGLGCLIAGARRVHAANGDIVLCAARRAVDRLLHTVGMDRVLPIVSSVDEAFAVLREAEGADRDILRLAHPRMRPQPVEA